MSSIRDEVKGTFVIRCSCTLKPGLGIRFVHDGQHLDLRLRHIVGHADIAHPQPELGASDPSEPLDTSLARTGRLGSEVSLDRIAHCSAFARPQSP
jgi:hypothetical protein